VVRARGVLRRGVGPIAAHDFERSTAEVIGDDADHSDEPRVGRMLALARLPLSHQSLEVGEGAGRDFAPRVADANPKFLLEAHGVDDTARGGVLAARRRGPRNDEDLTRLEMLAVREVIGIKEGLCADVIPAGNRLQRVPSLHDVGDVGLGERRRQEPDGGEGEPGGAHGYSSYTALPCALAKSIGQPHTVFDAFVCRMRH
jgi:hypothetical protein